jgi:hypothetical protein
MAAWYPVYRRHDFQAGSFMEPGKHTGNVKRKHQTEEPDEMESIEVSVCGGWSRSSDDNRRKAEGAKGSSREVYLFSTTEAIMAFRMIKMEEQMTQMSFPARAV